MFVYVNEKDGYINLDKVENIYYNHFIKGIQFKTRNSIYTKKATEEEFKEFIRSVNNCHDLFYE